MHERKEKPVELFGLKLVFQERLAQDVLNLIAYESDEPDSTQKGVVIFAQTVSDAIRGNRVAFWNRRKLRTAYLVKHLILKQIQDLFADVIELETGERPKFEIVKPARNNQKKKTLAE